jgi:hypothetical protein
VDAPTTNVLPPAKKLSPQQVAHAVEARRAVRKEEWQMQERLARLLNHYLDPRISFHVSLENKPLSLLSGLFGKRRNILPGMPDVMVLQARRGGLTRIVFVELKSRRGIASPAQRTTRDQMVPANARWWLARSPEAALAALKWSGIKFRCEWRHPRLPAWQGPFENPRARLPQHPAVAKERREARARWRTRQREREAAKLAAARGDAGGDIAA